MLLQRQDVSPYKYRLPRTNTGNLSKMSGQPQTPSVQITSELETGALTAIKRQLDAKEGGAVVRQSVKRHYEHLESLARVFASLAWTSARWMKASWTSSGNMSES